MRLPNVATGLASFALLATPASRLAMVAAGAAAATGCDPCSINGPITPGSLPDGQVEQAYFFQLSPPTEERCAEDVVFSLVAGSLPPGMKLSKGGALDGTPTRSGAYSFTITAMLILSDSYPDESAPRAYTLTILP
jgi:hypothetical protein